MKYGLMGEKLSHSYSPEIHRLFFELAGKKGEYTLFELKKNELGSFLDKARRDQFSGLNVTIPYKTKVLPFLERISPEAEKIGAVNTICIGDGLTGYNTDYSGIGYTLLKNRVNVKGKRALVTGSGGSAKAVVTCLWDYGAREIYMASRDPSSAGKKFTGIIPVYYTEVAKSQPFDVIINTTPVGLYPKTDDSPLTKEQLKGAGFLFDLIYNPTETKLMKMAHSIGIPAVNGLYMLVAQAVKAQELWGRAEEERSGLTVSTGNIMDHHYGLDMIDAIYTKMTRNSEHIHRR